MVDELKNVKNEELLETLRTANRNTDQYNKTREEIDSRITNNNKNLLPEKQAAIMENMGFSTWKDCEKQLVKEATNPEALFEFEWAKAQKAEKAAFARVQEMDRSLSVIDPAQRTEEIDRSPSVAARADAPNLHEHPSSSSNKAAQPAKGAEEMPQKLTEILKTLNEKATDEKIGNFIGENNAREFKGKMKEINTGLGKLPQEDKQTFVERKLGELDKFCDKQMEKIPTSGFKQFAKVIKHAVVAAISSFRGGEKHETNMQKFNQSVKEFSGSATKFKEQLESIKTTIKQPEDIDKHPSNQQDKKPRSMSIL